MQECDLPSPGLQIVPGGHLISPSQSLTTTWQLLPRNKVKLLLFKLHDKSIIYIAKFDNFQFSIRYLFSETK